MAGFSYGRLFVWQAKTILLFLKNKSNYLYCAARDVVKRAAQDRGSRIEDRGYTEAILIE